VIDVFLTTADYTNQPHSRLRYCMANVAHARWELESWAEVEVVTPQTLICNNREFQRRRRMYAEEHTNTKIYVVADDDCLLEPPPIDYDTIRKLFLDYPDFAILSAWPGNCVIHEWTPEDYKPVSNAEVCEHVSVGGIRFCRQGAMKHWPEMEPDSPGYDRIHAEWMRSNGWRVGYMRNVREIHMGEGYSSVWRKSVSV
jgi:hypothetical protein